MKLLKEAPTLDRGAFESDPGRSGSGLIKLWAIVGAVLIAVCLQGWVRWLAAGDLHATPHGAGR